MVTPTRGDPNDENLETRSLFLRVSIEEQRPYILIKTIEGQNNESVFVPD